MLISFGTIYYNHELLFNKNIFENKIQGTNLPFISS